MRCRRGPREVEHHPEARHEASDLLREFRAWLVENGKIPPMPKPVYDFLMEMENVALQRQIKAASTRGSSITCSR